MFKKFLFMLILVGLFCNPIFAYVDDASFVQQRIQQVVIKQVFQEQYKRAIQKQLLAQ